jgi:hypothetical protein
VRSSRNLCIAILTALCLSVASCSLTPRVVANLEQPDQALTQPHPPAPLLDPSRPLLLGELLLADQDLAALYNELRIKHEGLARYI